MIKKLKCTKSKPNTFSDHIAHHVPTHTTNRSPGVFGAREIQNTTSKKMKKFIGHWKILRVEWRAGIWNFKQFDKYKQYYNGQSSMCWFYAKTWRWHNACILYHRFYSVFDAKRSHKLTGLKYQKWRAIHINKFYFLNSVKKR